MNRGDTCYLMLNYTINGEPMVEGAYQEIELQINEQASRKSVKKLLSKGEIQWGTLTYEEDEEEKTFTGYYVHLSQEETFVLERNINEVQIRVMMSDEVGSSAIAELDVGRTLSKEVLVDDNA